MTVNLLLLIDFLKQNHAFYINMDQGYIIKGFVNKSSNIVAVVNKVTRTDQDLVCKP